MAIHETRLRNLIASNFKLVKTIVENVLIIWRDLAISMSQNALALIIVFLQLLILFTYYTRKRP